MADYLHYRKHLVSHHPAWEFTVPSVPPDDVIVEEPEQSIVRSLPDRAAGRKRTKAHHLWYGIVGARFHSLPTTGDIAQSLPDRARGRLRAARQAYAIAAPLTPPEEFPHWQASRLPGMVPGRPRAASQAYAILRAPVPAEPVGPEQDWQRHIPQEARGQRRTAHSAYTIVGSVGPPEIPVIDEPNPGQPVLAQPRVDLALRRQQAYYRFYSSRGGGAPAQQETSGIPIMPPHAAGRRRAAGLAYTILFPRAAIPGEVHGIRLWSLPDHAPKPRRRAAVQAYTGRLSTAIVEPSYPEELQHPVFPSVAPGLRRTGSAAYAINERFVIDDFEQPQVKPEHVLLPNVARGYARAANALYVLPLQFFQLPDDTGGLTITNLPTVARGQLRAARTAYEIVFPTFASTDEAQPYHLTSLPDRAAGRSRAAQTTYQVLTRFVFGDFIEEELLNQRLMGPDRAPGLRRTAVSAYWLGQPHTDLSAGTEGFPPFRVHFRRLSLEAVNAAQVSVLHTHENFLTLIHQHLRTISVPPDRPQTIRERRNG